MIKKMRKRFIRLSISCVATVMAIFTIIIISCFLFTTIDGITDTLHVIYHYHGSVPHKSSSSSSKAPSNTDNDSSIDDKGKEFSYSIRYFVLRFNDNGELRRSNLRHIASVSKNDLEPYLQKAVAKKQGYGYYNGFFFSVHPISKDNNMAIFLNSFQEIRTLKKEIIFTVIAYLISLLLVYVLVVLLSQKAMIPFENADRKQKQFITDAGHEIKTPLTVISTSLSLLELDDNKQKWINKIRSQTEKMSVLINALVNLTRLDEQTQPLNNKVFSFSNAVLETAQDFCDAVGAEETELKISVMPDILFYGDENAIRQLVSILADNALKYAVPRSVISLSLYTEKKKIILKCQNQCQPIPPQELEKLFDRFYRPDQSRNSATGGFGIGLSIAQNIVLKHHGNITATAPTQDSILFTAVFQKCKPKHKRNQRHSNI